ncbi:MAG: DUF3179 domain-containing protein [Pseudotabrizicola sp.]|uniref:DUF3179 domain-containing protein n=1 Tax=Pseudotabrizicola sp. TaxID=2939647 RepID=UPI00272F9CF7|nr:DUF3179 domain-containing protein [Pseudotabrizicola sp.]MDP2080359.1 DUF3179 domain-containing protein [Pseudotabrizicola sp.]MDZ7573798.1 DUF3179 domain-containing protein [Pseudotabrizicola sp.]
MFHFRPLAAFVIICALSSGAVHSDPAQWRAEWPDTDFSRSTINFAEVISGGPPKDGIPALDGASFIPVAAETRLDDREPVMTYEHPGEAPRAWPIRYLMWHEIVNDQVGGVPIVVTFCPLCNTGIIFDARIEGVAHSFGVSGKLRFSDMIMYDRQTQSWWQQALGDGIVGQHTGATLTQLPGWMESWSAFRDRNPNGLVMDEPDWRRNYGANPYVSYDSSIRPFLFEGDMPPHDIAPLMRVVRVGDRAWPLDRLRAAGTLTEAGVTLSWVKGQASALDTARIGDGAEVGNIRVRDAAGRDLVHDIPFAFAFHAFFPTGTWMLGQ